MKDILHFSKKHYFVAGLAALSFIVGCNSSAESTDPVSPNPPSESSSFNPLRMLGLAGDPPAPPATIAAGQKIRVRTTSSLSTKSNSAGETFVGSLEEPVMDGDRVVFPAGSTVVGRVTFSDPGGRVKGVAKLGIEVSEIQTPNGKTVPVNTGVYVSQAKKTHGKDAQKIGIGAGAGALIGVIAGGGDGAAKGAGVGAGMGTGTVLATRGDPAVISSESVVSFTLSESVTVEM